MIENDCDLYHYATFLVKIFERGLVNNRCHQMNECFLCNATVIYCHFIKYPNVVFIFFLEHLLGPITHDIILWAIRLCIWHASDTAYNHSWKWINNLSILGTRTLRYLSHLNVEWPYILYLFHYKYYNSYFTVRRFIEHISEIEILYWISSNYATFCGHILVW